MRYPAICKRREPRAMPGAEDDTEGEQAEGDTDANMSDWNEDEHTPTIRGEVEEAWSKLPKASKAKKHQERMGQQERGS